MFATTFYLEREPLALGDVPAAILSWLQNAGVVAVLIWSAVRLVEQGHSQSRELRQNKLSTLCISLAGLLYVCLCLLFVVTRLGASRLQGLLPFSGADGRPTVGDYMLTVAGGFALLAVCLPIFKAFALRLRWQRIWALARVSLKEALRKRVVLVFAAMALIFLFAEWFIRSKPEDQIRNYVSLVYGSIIVLFLLTASLLGAFSIPTDVKNQVIHTIVTKPVEKYEIVLGRFLGYGLLLTGGTAVIALLSLVYILRGVNPDAAFESKKARVPVYGQLNFWPNKGESVGREWDYRKYISGPQPNQPKGPRQYAIWSFPKLDADLAERTEPVPFEFTFDIFRLNRGQEGKGIYCRFTFADGRLDYPDIERAIHAIRTEYDKQVAALKGFTSKDEEKKAKARIMEELIQKYGVYEEAGIEVTDYHTQSVSVPVALFKKLQELEKTAPREGVPGAGGASMLNVLVNVEYPSVQQMLGAARRDLYLLKADRSFEINFLKGIAGLWCTFMLVLGLGIACSTYLSGVISWLCTMFLFGSGLLTDYIQSLASGRSTGGGPFESALRLIQRTPLAAPIDPGPTSRILQGTDAIFNWIMKLFLNIIPDVWRYDLHKYVASGFDIDLVGVLLVDNVLPLVGYLIPWGILAFYLMKLREIANPM
jgi:ABC-type transport system involved in multi-copper enzyme maturation permease subunit